MLKNRQKKKQRFQSESLRPTAKSAAIFLVALTFGASAVSQTSNNSETELVAKPAQTAITLKGVSSGGTLELASNSGKRPSGRRAWVIVTNQPGDSAQVVAGRLARQLEEKGIGIKLITTNGEATLILPGGGILSAEWLMGGTDTGFNFPAPPEAVSVSYNPATDLVTVQWVNPPGGYDWVSIHYTGTLDRVARLPGSSTSYTFKPFFIGRLFAWELQVLALGEKGGVASAGAPVLFDKRGVQQILAMNVPFAQGIAPGFEAWTYNSGADAIKFEQGNLHESTAEAKQFGGDVFCQVVKRHGPGSGGLLRRFLGLRPGHTYRVSARVNTLEAGSGDWAFSVHAAAEPAGRVRLNEAQLAGLAELPTKAKGPTAAQLGRYDSARHTAGQWVTVSSGDKRADNVAGDIVLPEGCDSITVWFRLEGKDAQEVAVAFDLLTIEDLGKR